MTGQPTCLTCPFHARNPAELAGTGECRHDPPRLDVVGMDPERGPVVVMTHPKTVSAHWCGRHPDFPAWFADRNDRLVTPFVRSDAIEEKSKYLNDSN